MTDVAGVIDREAFPTAMDGGYGEAEEDRADSLATLLRYLEIAETDGNLAPEIADEELANIGARVKREHDIDKASRKEWEDKNKVAMELAMQIVQAKNYPWPGAANVKYPLLTTAAMQFAARAYPAIVPGTSIVKGKVIGEDESGEKRSRANRVGQHMSYQLIEEMEEWEEDTDKLLHVLPIVGCAFRKSYFSPSMGRNVSELVFADHLVVNYWTVSLERAPRISHRFQLYPHEITERMRDGRFVEFDYGRSPDGGDDDEAPHWFIEQHRTIDLDGDGYPEPYIVTIHEEQSRVCRIVPRFEAEGVRLSDDGRILGIDPLHYFTKYGFIPAPDGSFYDLGFGALIGPISETINATINQMLDAGHLQNVGGGFIDSDLRLKKSAGTVRLRLGEYRRVTTQAGKNMSQSIWSMNHPGPSGVLFSLLGLLIDAGKEIAAVKDVLTGEAPQNAPATTTLALIEQGMKVFSGIYKRIHRSLKKELKKLYRLNALYMPPQAYFLVLDTPTAIAQEDYAQDDLDVVPVSDPTVVTDMQRLARAEALRTLVVDPGFDPNEINLRYLDALQVEEPQKLLAKGPAPIPPEVQQAMANEQAKTEAEILKTLSDVILNLAKAESEEAGSQIEAYQAQLETLLAGVRNGTTGDTGAGADGPGVRGLVGPSDNPSGPAIPSGPRDIDPALVGAGGAMDGGGPVPGAGL